MTGGSMAVRIALAGNPNSGKTTMFNRLTGGSQRVGNWPGVTVERKEGRLRGEEDAVIVDLPGIYSLSPYSPEEVVSRDFLLKDRPDAVINIVDASNLERNLYLTTQIVEAGIPTVIALNKMDAVAKEGTRIDLGKLSKAIGCPVVETAALKGDGVDDLARAALAAVGTEAGNALRYSKELEGHVSAVEGVIRGVVPAEAERWHALKLLERDERLRGDVGEGVWGRVEAVVSAMEARKGDDADSIVAEERYSLIGRIVGESVDRSGSTRRGETVSDRIDRVVTGRWLGVPVFAAVMFAIYFIAIETVGSWGTDALNGYIGGTVMPAAEGWLTDAGVAEWLVGLIVNGIIGGVGAVVGFLPQMAVLFLILVLLEECGYMSRVAFVMDHLFRRFGLSGKSLISVLVGMGCGVPGILSTRAIQGEAERRITAMTVTFMPCSAKLPAVALIAGALFGRSALVAISVYFIGILCILMSGVIMKKWGSLAAPPSHFIMELPPYHVPQAVSVARSTLERAWAFVRNAGTFVLLACVAVWFLSSYDWGLNSVGAADSMLAGIGNSLSWVFVPLGFGDDWEFTMATLTGLLAKENLVGTLGVLFDPGGAGGEGLWGAVGGALTPAGGYAFLLFNMICAPCVAAVAAMRHELGSWKGAAKAVAYQCSLAYAVALVAYQAVTLLSGGGLGWGIVPAAAALAVLAYLLAARDPFGPFRRSARDG